jgi:hypothetical protein
LSFIIAIQQKSGIEITIPNVGVRKFLVWESSNFEPELQAKYPDIRGIRRVGLQTQQLQLILVVVTRNANYDSG